MPDYRAFILEAGLDPANFRAAWAFGNGEVIDNPEMADELVRLVLTGQKTATASALAGYKYDEPLPAVDEKFDLILDSLSRPAAATRTSKVMLVKFADVTPEHAYKEGEGLPARCIGKRADEVSEADRLEVLDYWRRVHEAFWRDLGVFSTDMTVVCEEFEVLYARRDFDSLVSVGFNSGTDIRRAWNEDTGDNEFCYQESDRSRRQMTQEELFLSI